MPEYNVKLSKQPTGKHGFRTRVFQPCGDLAERAALAAHPGCRVVDVARRIEHHLERLRVESTFKDWF